MAALLRTGSERLTFLILLQTADERT